MIYISLTSVLIVLNRISLVFNLPTSFVSVFDTGAGLLGVEEDLAFADNSVSNSLTSR